MPIRKAEMKVFMSGAEEAELERHVKNARHYFEFGAGGSTLVAAKHKLQITVVESSPDWQQKVIKELPLDCNIEWRLVDINANPNNGGHPKDNSKRHAWPLYAEQIRHGSVPDLILIDGRFRVACALQALYVIGRETTVLVHDYTNRAHYHVIEKFYERASHVGTLQQLRRKAEIDFDHVEQLLAQYNYDSR